MSYYPNSLDARWVRARNYESFSHDGILSSDPDDYFEADVRIMYLLKEAPVGSYPCADDGGLMIRGIDATSRSCGSSGGFWKHIGMWTYVVNTLNHCADPCLSDFFEDHDENGYSLCNAAYVNIKKGDGRPYSSYSDLKRYARRGRSFLNEQIDMLAPDVIVCCGSYRVYAEHVCDGDIPRGSQDSPVWDGVNGRIVIDWHHPAGRGSLREDFRKFTDLCEQEREWFEDI